MQLSTESLRGKPKRVTSSGEVTRKPGAADKKTSKYEDHGKQPQISPYLTEDQVDLRHPPPS